MSDAAAAAPAVTTTAGVTGAPAITTTPANGSSSSGEWYSTMPEDLRGYVQNKGWKDPGIAVDSYRNLEKLMGVPKEQLLRLPKDEGTPEEWGQVYDRLGRPSKADEYKIPVPDGGDTEFAKWAEGLFHEQGLNRKQATALAEKWNERVGGMNKQALENQNNQVLEQENSLKKEWGKAFDQNVEIGKRAAREFGMDAATIDKLESALGYAGVFKFMHAVGSKLGEHSFVSGNQRQEFGGVLTPEAARDRISSLKHDADFVRRYVAGDIQATSEMKRMHEMAYPE